MPCTHRLCFMFFVSVLEKLASTAMCKSPRHTNGNSYDTYWASSSKHKEHLAMDTRDFPPPVCSPRFPAYLARQLSPGFQRSVCVLDCILCFALSHVCHLTDFLASGWVEHGKGSLAFCPSAPDMTLITKQGLTTNKSRHCATSLR